LTGCSNATQVSATEFKSLYKYQGADSMHALKYKGIKEEKVIIERWEMNVSFPDSTETFWAHKSEFDSEYIDQIEAERIEKEKAHAEWLKIQQK